MSPGQLMIAAVIGFLLVGLVTVGLRAYARVQLGDIVLSVTEPRVAMGQVVEYVLQLRPRGRLRLNALTVTCLGYEWIQWTETESYTDSEGKSRTRTVTRTRTHTLHEESEELERATVLKPNSDFEWSGSFAIPRKGPPSFAASDNAIRWCLRVDVGIDNLPDVTETFDFEVRPVVRLKA